MQDCFMQQVLALANLIIILDEANNQKRHFQQMILVLAGSSHGFYGRCKHGSLEIVIDMTQEMWNRAIFSGRLLAEITIYFAEIGHLEGFGRKTITTVN